MKILAKIVFSVVLLLVGWIGVYGVGRSIAFFKFNVLSGLFLTDERIVPGGALDQSGLLKVAFVLMLSLAFHLSGLALQRTWLRVPPRWFQIVLYAPLAGLLIPQIGLWVSYYWYLICYIHAMGWTFARLLGLVCGMPLFACCVFLFVKLVREMCVAVCYSSGKCA